MRQMLLRGSAELLFYFFFFQAEDGIRDDLVTGVQTCALTISAYVRDGGHNFSRGAINHVLVRREGLAVVVPPPGSGRKCITRKRTRRSRPRRVRFHKGAWKKRPQESLRDSRRETFSLCSYMAGVKVPSL